MSHRIVTLPGDGIGPEIMAPTLELLRALGSFEFEEHLFGGSSIDAHGVALTEETLAAVSSADAVLLGAVGGPRWDTTDPVWQRVGRSVEYRPFTAEDRAALLAAFEQAGRTSVLETGAG